MPGGAPQPPPAVRQVALSLCFMAALHAGRALDCGGMPRWAVAKSVAPLAILWMLYVQSGVIALRYLTVPMYSVLRRATTLLVVAGEYFAFAKVPTPAAAAAIAAMAAGAAIAGSADLAFSAPGYAWVAVCVVSTAAYLILIRLLGDKTGARGWGAVGRRLAGLPAARAPSPNPPPPEPAGLNQHALLFYNNLISLPLMAAFFFLATDEPAGVAAAPQLRDPRFVAFLLLSASQAFLLNLCIFWCTTINSPLATTVTGQMKDILTTGLGLFLFGDVVFNARNLLGVAVGLGGGVAYSLQAALARAPGKGVAGSPGRRGRP